MMNDDFILAFDNYVKNSSMGNKKKYTICRKFILEYVSYKSKELSMEKQKYSIPYMMSIFIKLTKKGVVNLHVLYSLTSMAVKVMYYQEVVIKASIPTIIEVNLIMDFQEPIVLLEEICSKIFKTESIELTMAKDLIM